MAARLQGTFYSDRDNSEFVVTIDDTDFSGSATDFNLTSLTFSWKGENEQRFNPLLASTANLGLKIENSTIMDFVNDLIGANEERFKLKVEKNSNLFWAGHVLLDISAIEDAPVNDEQSPIFNLKASDGLGRLKEIDYNNDGAAYTGKETFIDHLFKIFGKIGTDDLWGTDDEYLYVNCLWYEDQHTYNLFNDPLVNTRFDHKAMITIDNKGNQTFMSCYDVLQEICKVWGARFLLSGGRWRFEQVNELRKSSFNVVHRYKKAGTAFGTDLTSLQYQKILDTDIGKIKGGTRLFFPGLKCVEINYKHFSTINHIAGADFNRSFEFANLGSQTWPIQTLTDVRSNTNQAKLLITFRITYSATYSSGFPTLRYKFRLRVKIGTYYLRRTATNDNGTIVLGDTTWSTSTDSYYEFYGDVIISSGLTYYNNIQIITPPIEEDGDGEFVLELDAITDPGGGTVTDAFDVNMALINAYMEVLELGNVEDRSNVTKFIAENTADGNNAKLLRTTLLGDGPGPNTFGHLEVYDDSDWLISSSWKRQNTGAGVEISQLLANEILKSQYKHVEKNLGVFINNLGAHSTIVKGGLVFMLGGGTFDVGKDEASGEWWEIGISDAITIQETSSDFIENPDVREEPFTTADDTPPGLPEEVEIGAPLDEPALVSSTDTTAGTTNFDAIAVSATSDSYIFLEGDLVNYIHPFTGQSQQFEVDEDIESGDTAVSVLSQTVNNNFPAGSFLNQDPTQRARQNSLGRFKLITLILAGNDADVSSTTSFDNHYIDGSALNILTDSSSPQWRFKKIVAAAISTAGTTIDFTMELRRGGALGTTMATGDFDGTSDQVELSITSGEEEVQDDWYLPFLVENGPNNGILKSLTLYIILVIN